MWVRRSRARRFVRCARLVGAGFLALSCADDGQRPLLASDGLVFVRNGNLVRARLADGATVPLTANYATRETRPLWVRSLARILYGTHPLAKDSLQRLALLDPESGRTSSMSPAVGSRETEAAVSPDGRQVVFAFWSPDGDPPRGLRLRNLVSEYTTLLARTADDAHFLALSFSPDAKMITLQRHRRGRGDSIWTMRPTTGSSGRRPLIDDRRWHAYAPHFTHDGSSVVFSRSAYDQEGKKGKADVGVMQLATGRISWIARDPKHHERRGVPSPTRAEVVFASDRAGGFDLFLANLDGTDLRKLTETPRRSETDVRWSPDGERLVFTAKEGGERRVVAIDRAGAVLFEAEGHTADWMPPWRDAGS